ncbi:hypothetical protein PIB30_051932 [Stylosanthes scabra]|uniref:DUF4216 domain-containing protein n=1 Tax=Stylosanthes scabra TaxID=79078 RepID=A0ABU6UHH1_9FABA|nr:hypothetical protein [Stylosanthes scabra]
MTIGRNDEAMSEISNSATFFVFIQEGVCLGSSSEYWLEEKEKSAAHLHMLLNCEQVSLTTYRVFMFKCEWFGPRSRQGTQRHKDYNITEVNTSKKYQVDEPIPVRLVPKIEPPTNSLIEPEIIYIRTDSVQREDIDEEVLENELEEDELLDAAESSKDT